jgi:SAM-dependent methyltransferase
LVPGCGTGHDVRLLAEQGAEVVGLDLAARAIRQAGQFPPVGNERYVQGDFLKLEPPHLGAYDWVVEHTCLCALEPEQRIAYARAVVAALRPEGRFLAVFFRDVGERDGSGPPYSVTAEASRALFGEAFEVLDAFTPTQSYPSRPIGAEEVVLMAKRAS